MKPLRPCNQPGCPDLVRPPDRYCKAHTWTDEQRRQYNRARNRDRHREYDRTKRDREAKRFYDSTAWKRLRIIVLQRDNYLCQQCLLNRKITPAEHVDHIKPMREHPELRLDPENLRSLCQPCHSKRHATERMTGGA